MGRHGPRQYQGSERWQLQKPRIRAQLCGANDNTSAYQICYNNKYNSAGLTYFFVSAILNFLPTPKLQKPRQWSSGDEKYLGLDGMYV